MEFMDMLADMEINGLKFDTAKAQQLVARYQKLVNVLESKLKKIAADCLHPEVIDEFNPRSTRELSVLFYGGEIKRRKRVPKITEKNVKVRMPYIFVYKNGDKRIKLRSSDHPRTKCLRYVFADVPYYSKGLAIQPLPKTETSWAGYFSTDKSVIEQLQAHETNGKMAIKICLKISKINKMLETFQGKSKGSGLIAKVDSNGFLHTNYNQARTGTGRLSSSDPNNQNLPRAGTSPIKTCIVPRFDQIVDADLSQIELVVPTQYSQDPVMLHENNTGIDRHDRTRKDLMKLPKTKQNRVYAKIFNFRMIYRGSPWGFFKDPHMPRFKLKQWEQVVKDYWKKYKVFDQWHKQIIAHVIQGDGTLQTPLGRWYKFKMFNGKYNEHQIVNYPIQGTAGADILPLCAVLIYKELKKLKLKSIPVLTVHDSIVFDCPANEVDTVADITMHVFNNTDSYISQYFGVNWIAKITGEVEAGDNYGSTTQIR